MNIIRNVHGVGYKKSVKMYTNSHTQTTYETMGKSKREVQVSREREKWIEPSENQLNQE